MQEAMSRRTLQQDAYRRGAEARQAQGRVRHVLQGVELLVLSADYAHLFLFKEQQHSWEMTDLHERAELRMVAFRQGYEGFIVGDTKERSKLDDFVTRRRRPKRGTKNRLACSHST